MSHTDADKERIAINIIAKELESRPEIHKKVLIDIGLDPEFQAVGTMLRIVAVMSEVRFNELYDKHLRKYAKIEYNDRMNELSDGGLSDV